MAVPGVEFELIAGGVEDRNLERGDWAQNVWRPDGQAYLSVRSGFGQLGQIDTTLSNVSNVFQGVNPVDFSAGYQKHLGSHAIETEFGTTQILSVFQVRSSSGEGVDGSEADSSNRWGAYYSVSIHDVDTGEFYEEVLHNHTGQNKSPGRATTSNSPSTWHGCYETNQDFDRQNFVGGLDAPFFFLGFQSGLIFGNEFTGILSYFPVDFRKIKTGQVESAQKNDWVNGRSESSLINRLTAVDGVFTEGFTYRNNSELPAVQAIASVGGRLAVAGKNEVFFSDVGTPNSFAANNFIQVPTSNRITAMSQVLDNLMIFTEDETFFYQPSVGKLASSGFLVTVSNTVGCVSQTAVYSTGSGTFWVSKSGIYLSGNGTELQELSTPISSFFAAGITSPLNHYLTASGVADPVNNEQPTTLYRYKDGETVSLSYWEEKQALVACFASSNVCWVYTGGEWSIWPLESSVAVSGGVSFVGVTKNVEHPFVMYTGDRLFMVGSVETETVTDAITTEQVDSTSYYLMQYGRGGALDRSIKDEDSRTVVGYWKLVYGSATNSNRYYIGKPTYNSNTSQYEVQIDLVTDATHKNPTASLLSFDFQDSNFSFNGTGLVPTERLLNAANYTLTLTPAAGKDNLSIALGAAVTTNTTPSQRNPWYTLTGSVAAGNFWGYGISNVVSTVTSASGTANPSVYVWQSYFGALNANDNKAQAVDWAYKGIQVSDGNAQIQSRGLFTSMVSHGTATSELSTGWLWGVYNTLLGSDWKDWSSQVIDFTGGNIESIANKLSVRSRFRSSTSITPKTFNNAATYGDYLIDDEEFDTIQTSDSTRGETISYMMFGFMRNKAESIRIKSSKMLLRLRSKARRRVGR